MDLDIVNSLKGQLNSVLHHGIKRFNVNGNVTTVAISLLIGYLSYLLVYGLFFCPTRHIPGPVLTRFGQAYWRYILMAGSVSAEIHRLHLKYGSVVRLSPTSIDAQLLEVSQDAWKGHNPKKTPWDKDPWFQQLLRLRMKDVDNLVSIPTFKEGMRVRRLMGAPFARKFLLDGENVFKICVERAMKRINELAGMNEGIVDIHRQHKLYALDVITEFAFGGYFKGGSSGGPSPIDLMELATPANVIDTFFPLVYKFLASLPWKAFDWVRSRDTLLQISDDSIREYKKNVKPGLKKDALSSLIEAKDEHGLGFSHEELVSASFILMFGGVDTTAVSLTYVMYLLAKHPQYMQKIAFELSGYSEVQSLKSVELEKLPYLNAVIRETMRLSTFWSDIWSCLSARRESRRRTIVSRAAYAACRDPKLFPNPYSFNPERFLPVFRIIYTRWLGLSAEDESKMWDQNMIFSDGPRVCLGKDMALLEIRLLISAVILKYEIWTCPEYTGMLDEEMIPHDSFVIAPPKWRCIIKLKPRKA